MLIERGAPGFDDLLRRLIWNVRSPERRSPDAVVLPVSTEEVAAAVRDAARRGQRVALRGSGHNYQGAALRDEGMLVDIGALDRVEIDAVSRRARVGAGVKGGRLIRQLAGHGLAFPIGHCADVALSGYVLAGGIGWNYGEWGPACANVTAIEMVTAAGEIVVATADEFADLFWAARGAGCAFFAAVTGYELVLHELPATAFVVDTAFDAGSAPHIAEWLDTAGAAADSTVELICLIGPDVHTGRPAITVRAVASAGSVEGARKKLAPMLSSPPGATLLRPAELKALPFADLPGFSSLPGGKRVAADQVWSDHPIGDLLRATAHLAEGPQRSSAISLTALGGRATAPGMPGGIDGALSVGGTASAGIYALWDGAEDDRRHVEWVAAADAALAPFRSGRYVGEADVFVAPDRLAQCFTPHALGRLRELRARYDPDGVFLSCLPAGADKPGEPGFPLPSGKFAQGRRSGHV